MPGKKRGDAMRKRVGEAEIGQHDETACRAARGNGLTKACSAIAFFLVALLLAGCQPDNATKTNADSIDLVPVFSASSAKALGARMVMPKLTSQADLFYALMAPPIFRFESASSAGLKVGDTYTTTLLGSQVNLLISRDGTDIVFAGPIYETASDGATVRSGKIEVRYDPSASTFQCRTEILIADDASGSNTGWSNFNCYVINEIPRTALASDHSFAARFYMTAFLGMSTPLEFQWVDRGEFFSGPGDSGGWVVGYVGATFSDGGLSNVTLQSEGTFAAMTSAGKPLPAATFEPIRDAVVAAHDALKTQTLNNGSPMLGYRIYDASGAVTANVVYNGVSPVSGSLYMPNPDVADSYLKDATGGTDLVFAADSGDAGKMAHNQANLDQMIKAFPVAAWRTRSTLKTLFADWSN
jgi:hypothetical protein